MNDDLTMPQELARTLASIKKHDTDYDIRAMFIYDALSWAAGMGLPCGFRIDPADPRWPVAFIELPTGQVSWHMPQYAREWDGHTTARKYARIDAYVSDNP